MKFILSIFFIFAFIVMPVRAQETATQQANMSDLREREVTVLEDEYAGKYVLPTVANLSQLYWEKGALDLENDAYIDNYLLINECDIYKQFYNDEFEWARIRKATRMMLQSQSDEFSDQFQIMMPIDLGRYDMKRKGFPLINNTSFLDLRRIEIGGNSLNADICGNKGNIDGYPRNLILVLSKPFNFDFVELDEHIAQAYIIRQKYEPAKMPGHLKDKNFNRLAFARIRMKMDKYQGETNTRGQHKLAIMFGRLEGIDIFEDDGQKRLLKSIDLD